MFVPQLVYQTPETLDAPEELIDFDTLYPLYLPQVYRYLLARVGNVADAQDLASETFLAALQGLPTYHGERPFAAWVLGIARHKVADYL
jgi:RNA polymerase sigma-70 factor, ECF subfamily